MKKVLPLALQLYTLRAELSRDWQGTLERVAAMGYLGVETAGFDFAPSVEAVKAKLDALGLVIVAAHAPLPLGDQASSILETMKALACDRLICPGTGRDRFDSLSDIRERAATFNTANEVARDAGLRFGLHNHWWEFGRVNGHIGFDLLHDLLDEAIFYEIDTYWVQVGGVDSVALLKRLGDRVPLVHIKDGPAGREDAMTAVGDGVMDFHRIVPAAGAAEWLIVELDRCDGDMMTAVANSIAYLRREGLGRGKA